LAIRYPTRALTLTLSRPTGEGNDLHAWENEARWLAIDAPGVIQTDGQERGCPSRSVFGPAHAPERTHALEKFDALRLETAALHLLRLTVSLNRTGSTVWLTFPRISG
jgi:hypothetical protein